MGQTFSKRSLTLADDPVIHIFGDAAVAEFHWDFVATVRSNGSEAHTKGRESQVWVRFPENGWRLVARALFGAGDGDAFERTVLTRPAWHRDFPPALAANAKTPRGWGPPVINEIFWF